MKPGSDPQFIWQADREAWRSEWTSPLLRSVIHVAEDIYREHGALRLRVLKLRGDGPYAYGKMADISPGDLPGVPSCAPGDDFRLPAWVARRLNLLCPWEMDTAIYEGDRIVIRVPSTIEKAALFFSEWTEWGPTGKRVLFPSQRLLTVERNGIREVL